LRFSEGPQSRCQRSCCLLPGGLQRGWYLRTASAFSLSLAFQQLQQHPDSGLRSGLAAFSHWGNLVSILRELLNATDFAATGQSDCTGLPLAFLLPMCTVWFISQFRIIVPRSRAWGSNHNSVWLQLRATAFEGKRNSTLSSCASGITHIVPAHDVRFSLGTAANRGTMSVSVLSLSCSITVPTCFCNLFPCLGVLRSHPPECHKKH